MKISWLGHACFLLETFSGTKIITDPYESGSYSGAVGYAPVNTEADIVTVSHQHADHNYTQESKGAKIIDNVGKTIVKDIEIEGILSYHDDKNGSLRGESIIFIFNIERLKVVHLGDLGTQHVDIEKFKNADIVIIPVGGIFTLSAAQADELLKKIMPKITIPMHFKTPKLGFDIDGVDKFLNLRNDYERKDILEVNPQNISSFKKNIILNHQR